MVDKVLLKAANNQITIDTRIENIKMVDVYSGTIKEIKIGVHKGTIIGFGDFKAKQIIDGGMAYVAPGFIDGHVHIESSMMTPPAFSKVIVPKGTTTIIADPHEIGNVSGRKGVEYMLKASEAIPLNVYIMVPSCVPATKLENAGATITKEDIAILKNHPRVIGLGEVMDYPAVINGDKSIHDKIALMQDTPIDGHAPDIVGYPLNAYALSGIMTDHECTTIGAMHDRIERGMYVHLREGSATRNTSTLLKGITKENSQRTLFCTDDKHPEDIDKEGHINYNVNLAIASGIDPIDAIRMATLNPATCYHLKDVGGIAPGKRADLIFFNDLSDISPHQVMKDGKIVVSNFKPLFDVKPLEDKSVMDTVHLNLDTLDFKLKLTNEKVHVIGLIKNNITTKKLIETVDVEDGYYVNNPKQDILKLAVIERHKNTGNIGIGLVKGYGLENGAVAMSIAHDSHNIVVIGDNDTSMHLAVKKLHDLQGGIVLVKGETIDDYLQLEISGIMTNQPENSVSSALKRMKEKLDKMGLNNDLDDPFISLAFLSLPVIPSLKLTDTGLFDVNKFKHISVEVKDDEK